MTSKPVANSLKLKPSVLSVKVVLLTSVLGSTTFPPPTRAGETPEFSYLPPHGLAFVDASDNPRELVKGVAFWNTQSVDTDNDGDLDLILANDSSQQAFLMINVGNHVAPAFQREQYLGDTNVFQDRLIPFVGDINGDGLVDLCRSGMISNAQEPFILLNSPNGIDSNKLNNEQWLNLETLVGNEKANEIIAHVSNEDSTSEGIFPSYLDVDDDKDLDIVFSWGYKNEHNLSLINQSSDNQLQFSVNLDQISIGSKQETTTTRFASLYGNKVDHRVIERITTVSEAIISNGIPWVADLDGDQKMDIMQPFTFEEQDLSVFNNHPGVWVTNAVDNQLINLFFKNDTVISENGSLVINVKIEDKSIFSTVQWADIDGDKDSDLIAHLSYSEEIVPLNLVVFINQGFKETLLLENGLGQAKQYIFEQAEIKISTERDNETSVSQLPADTYFHYNFIDVDSDGDSDLMATKAIGGEGTVFYAENKGLDGSGSVNLSALQKNPFNLTPEILGSILSGYDIDQDGDTDLFSVQLQELKDSTIYLENKGTKSNPSFSRSHSMPFSLNPNLGAPEFSDLDQDGDIDAYTLKSALGGYEGFIQLNNQINTRDDQIAHVSVRAFSESGEGRIIGGFEVTGQKPQQVVIKGIGPSLVNQGVSKPLPDPTLTLFKDQQIIASNDNWQNDAKAKELAGTAFEPAHANEALLNLELAPGTYTVHLTDKQQQAGIGIVSIDTPTYAYLTNPRPKQRSFRVQVGNGEDIAIVGFVVQDGPKKVLIKGIGPSLAAQGVQNALADPELLLFDGTTLVASNQNWPSLANADLLQNAEQAPSDSREAIILQKLEPGTYTVHLRGQKDSRGVGIIGISTLDE